MQNTLRYLIVDDEPFARKLILAHAQKIDFLQEVGSCSSAMEALSYLQREKVDVIFLDIQMPGLSGLDFVRALHQPPAIVLTTAFREFAVDAFELNAVDYLVKPISLERFLKCIDKVVKSKSTDEVARLKPIEAVLHIRSDRKVFPVPVASICIVESLDNHVKIHLKDRVLITYESISSIEKKLSKEQFVRIHRSFIVSKSKIDFLAGEYVKVGNKELPFGRTYKQLALALLKSNP